MAENKVSQLHFRGYNAMVMTQYSDFASEALGSDYWVATNPFIYYLGELGSDEWVEIPHGYLTDGASVPRIFWNIVPPWGKYGQAAIVHDFLCEYLMVKTKTGERKITRKECDQIFLEAMLVMGVPERKAKMIHAAVSLYRTVACVNAPSFDDKKFAVEEALRKRFDATGTFN